MDMDNNFNFDDEFDLNLNNASVPSSFASKMELFRKPSASPLHMSSSTSTQRSMHSKRINEGDGRVDSPLKKDQTTSAKRKFPGPAGSLPDKPPKSFNDSTLILEYSEKTHRSDESIPLSQTSFTETPPYKKLKADYGLDDSRSPLNAITVDFVKKKKLKGFMIPFIALVVESVDIGTIDPVVTLKDSTGTLQCVIPSGVWNEICRELKVGSALVLKEVGFLYNPLSTSQCLSIDKSNIAAIYTSKNDDDVSVTTKQHTNRTDLALRVEDWHARVIESKPTTPYRSPCLQRRHLPVDLFQMEQKQRQPELTASDARGQRLQSVGAATTPASSPVTHRPTASRFPGFPPDNLDLSMNDEDFADFDENMAIPDTMPSPPNGQSIRTSENTNRLDASSILSQDEEQMVQEVLADLELDDFE